MKLLNDPQCRDCVERVLDLALINTCALYASKPSFWHIQPHYLTSLTAWPAFVRNALIDSKAATCAMHNSILSPGHIVIPVWQRRTSTRTIYTAYVHTRRKDKDRAVGIGEPGDESAMNMIWSPWPISGPLVDTVLLSIVNRVQYLGAQWLWQHTTVC